MELDSLFVSLSLDPAKFQKGTKEGIESLRKFRTDAKAAADDTERQAAKMADGFSLVTKELLGLGLAIAGASSLKSLVVGTVQAADSVNLLSRAMGLNEAITSKWVNTARRAGVDQGAAQGAFRSLTAAAGAVMAQVPGAQGAIGAPFLQSLGIENPQFNDPDKLAAQIVKGFQQSGKSPGDLLAIAQHIPGGEMFLQIAKEFKTVEALNKALADSVTTTHEQAEAARRLTAAMTDLQLAVEKKLNQLIPPSETSAKEAISSAKSVVEGDPRGAAEHGLKAIAPATTSIASGMIALDRWVLGLLGVKPITHQDRINNRFVFGTETGEGGTSFGMPMPRERPRIPGGRNNDRFPGLGPGASADPWGGGAPNYSRTIRIDAVNLTLPAGTRDPQDFANRFTSAVSAIEAQQGPR